MCRKFYIQLRPITLIQPHYYILKSLNSQESYADNLSQGKIIQRFSIIPGHARPKILLMMSLKTFFIMPFEPRSFEFNETVNIITF